MAVERAHRTGPSLTRRPRRAGRTPRRRPPRSRVHRAGGGTGSQVHPVLLAGGPGNRVPPGHRTGAADRQPQLHLLHARRLGHRPGHHRAAGNGAPGLYPHLRPAVLPAGGGAVPPAHRCHPRRQRRSRRGVGRRSPGPRLPRGRPRGVPTLGRPQHRRLRWPHRLRPPGAASRRPHRSRGGPREPRRGGRGLPGRRSRPDPRTGSPPGQGLPHPPRAVRVDHRPGPSVADALLHHRRVPPADRLEPPRTRCRRPPRDGGPLRRRGDRGMQAALDRLRVERAHPVRRGFVTLASRVLGH